MNAFADFVRMVLMLYGRYILIAAGVVLASIVAVSVASAGELEDDPMFAANFGAGGYAGTIVSIGLRLQSFGIESQKSYIMARKCAGEPDSVSAEARRYMTRESTVMEFNTAIVLIMHDRCGLLEEKLS